MQISSFPFSGKSAFSGRRPRAAALPQPNTLPPRVTAMVCESPTETATIPSPRRTATHFGASLAALSPCPRRPSCPPPHVKRSPAAITAQLAVSLAATQHTLNPLKTITLWGKVSFPSLRPMPSGPKPLLLHEKTVPFSASPSEW
jgi:hypothetical protein